MLIILEMYLNDNCCVYVRCLELIELFAHHCAADHMLVVIGCFCSALSFQLFSLISLCTLLL